MLAFTGIIDVDKEMFTAGILKPSSAGTYVSYMFYHGVRHQIFVL